MSKDLMEIQIAAAPQELRSPTANPVSDSPTPAELASQCAGVTKQRDRALEILRVIVENWDEDQRRRVDSIADEPWSVQCARKLLKERDGERPLP